MRKVKRKVDGTYKLVLDQDEAVIVAAVLAASSGSAGTELYEALADELREVDEYAMEAAFIASHANMGAGLVNTDDVLDAYIDAQGELVPG